MIEATSSSSAPGRQAACLPRGFPNDQTSAFCCWRRAEKPGIPISPILPPGTSAGAPRSTGISRLCLSAPWQDARIPGRGVAWWAGPARCMRWVMSAAIRKTSTGGPRPALPGGTGPRSGPTSFARKRRPCARRGLWRRGSHAALPACQAAPAQPGSLPGRDGARAPSDPRPQWAGPGRADAQHPHDRRRPAAERRRRLFDRGRSRPGEPCSTHRLARRPAGLRRHRARNRGSRTGRRHGPPPRPLGTPWSWPPESSERLLS